MKVKIKSFEEIARYIVGMPLSTFQEECAGFTLEGLLSAAFVFDNKEIEVDNYVNDCGIECYKHRGALEFAFPRFFVDEPKQYPLMPEAKPYITAYSIQDMQGGLLTGKNIENILTAIKKTAEISKECRCLYCYDLFNKSITDELHKRGFATHTYGDNNKQQTCISW
ncbi:MAG: hypothetical protein PHW12_00215 [Smithella sp.]|nr:hypothetical protein [Smithella sp.]